MRVSDVKVVEALPGFGSISASSNMSLSISSCVHLRSADLFSFAAGGTGAGASHSVMPIAAASRLVTKQREHIVSPWPSFEGIQLCCMTVLAHDY